MAAEQLRVTDGKERGKVLPIDRPLLVGRSAPDEEGRLEGDREISRHHGRIARDAEGRLTVEDFGSSNGTFVNGEPVEGVRTLNPGDEVRMGATVMEVADPSRPAAAPAGPAAELVVAGGPDAGRRLDIGDQLVIGRTVDGEGRLSEDRELSRRHARVGRDAQG